MVQRATTRRQPTAAAATTTIDEVLGSPSEPTRYSLDSSSMGAAYQTRAKLTRSYPFLSATPTSQSQSQEIDNYSPHLQLFSRAFAVHYSTINHTYSCCPCLFVSLFAAFFDPSCLPHLAAIECARWQSTSLENQLSHQASTQEQGSATYKEAAAGFRRSGSYLRDPVAASAAPSFSAARQCCSSVLSGQCRCCMLRGMGARVD